MSSTVDSGIAPGAIKDRQISGQAKIDPSKLARVDEGQVLIGQTSKKLSAKPISGDGTLSGDGTFTLNKDSVETLVKTVLNSLGIEAGAQANMSAQAIKKIYEDLPTVRQFKPAYGTMLDSATSVGVPGALVRRSSSGSVSITVEDLTDGIKVTTPAGTGTDESGDNKLTFDKQKKPITELIATYDPDGATGAGEFEVDHGLGLIPIVRIFSDDDCGNYDEIDMYIENTETKTKIKWNSIDTKIRAIIK